jgi:hypothetical protein
MKAQERLYSSPKIFAIAAIGRYLRAHCIYAALQSFELCKSIVGWAAILGLIIAGFALIGGARNPSDNDLFGHYALSRFEKRVIKGERWHTQEALESGHRCDRREEIPENRVRTDCLDKSGSKTRTVSGSKDYDISCCVKVIPESDKESLAKWRRFFLWIGFPARPNPILLPLVLIALFLGAVAFGFVGIAISTVSFGFFVVFDTSLQMLLAVCRLSWVVFRTSSLLDVSTWDPPLLAQHSVLLTHISDLHISARIPYELRIDPAGYKGKTKDFEKDHLASRLRFC